MPSLVIFTVTMNKLIYIFYFFCCFASFSQSEELAQDYFDRGEFQKALISYQKLYEEKKGNINYFMRIVEIHQQLEQLDIAEQLLLDMASKSQNPQHRLPRIAQFAKFEEHLARLRIRHQVWK